VIFEFPGNVQAAALDITLAAGGADKAAKHCMTEKPLARNFTEADAMIAAAKRVGTRLAVAEYYQFREDSTQARRVIDAGLIGTVFMVRAHELWRIGARPGSWWFQQETAGGGSLISLGIHSVRTLRSCKSRLGRGRVRSWGSVLGRRRA